MTTVRILDVPIHRLTKQQVLEKIEAYIGSGQPHQIATVNNEFIVEAQHNHLFKEVLTLADIAIADSTGVVLAAKLQGVTLVRIPGADLVQDLARHATQKDYSLYLLGGANGVAQTAAKKLTEKFPGLKIVGAEEGVTDKVDVLSKPPQEQVGLIIERIRQAKPDILLVAFGAPKQDLFIEAHKAELGVPVMMGVGGTLDFLAGKAKRAPKLLRSLGLEWLWRLIREPKRFKRIWRALVIFPLMVIFKGGK